MPKKMEREPQDFRALVREALAARGWSVYRLAQESGVAENTYGNWLRGDRETLNSAALSRAFAALGIEAEIR